MRRQRLHHGLQFCAMQKLAWVAHGISGRQKITSYRLNATDKGPGIRVTLQILRDAGAAGKSKPLTDGGAMEVPLDQQHGAFAFLSKSDGQVQGNGGLPIVRLRAGNEKPLQL